MILIWGEEPLVVCSFAISLGNGANVGTKKLGLVMCRSLSHLIPCEFHTQVAFVETLEVLQALFVVRQNFVILQFLDEYLHGSLIPFNLFDERRSLGFSHLFTFFGNDGTSMLSSQGC